MSSSSCLPSVGCRKRVVRSCQDPRYDAVFQRPYVSDVDPYFVRTVSIRSSRSTRIDIPAPHSKSGRPGHVVNSNPSVSHRSSPSPPRPFRRLSLSPVHPSPVVLSNRRSLRVSSVHRVVLWSGTLVHLIPSGLCNVAEV